MRAERWIGALSCALLVGACGGGGPDTRPDVLLVVVDTLRADHLSPYGYERPTAPFLESLAAEGVLCARVTAQAPWTRPSMVSLFAGQYLTDYRDHAIEQAPSLPELFRAQGYRTIGISGNQLITSEAGFARGFEYFDSRPPMPGENESLPYREADALLESLRVGLRRSLGGAQAHAAQAERAPVFVYLHLMDPHAPYAERAAYEGELAGAPAADLARQRADFERARGSSGSEAVWDELLAERARYDQEVRHTDERVRQAVALCERWGLMEDAVVALAADHGEGLWDHPDPRAKDERLDDPRTYFLGGHGSHLHQELLATPMLWWGPGRIPAGVRIDDPVENVDLLPTLVQLCELPAPRRLDGHSLVDAMDGHELPRSTSHAYMMFASTVLEHETGWKLVEPTPAGAARGWETALYDLGEDPDELVNVAADHPDVVTRLRGALSDWRGRFPTQSSMARRGADELRQMEALGYGGLAEEMEEDEE